MLTNYLGEVYALSTALCWAITSTAFEYAGKKIGSLNLNIIRLWFGFVFLMIYTSFTRGLPLPSDASIHAWLWLTLSGIIGLFLGDILLFEAFTRIGARISMLIFSSVPPMSAILAYLILGDKMTLLQIIGMFVTLTGIGIVILTRDTGAKKVKLAHPLVGILLAFGGAFGQSLGYIVGKLGIRSGIDAYDSFAATQIRIVAAVICFTLLISIRKGWPNVIKAFTYKKAMAHTVVGSIFGPFIGVSLSLLALNYTTPGVASTLTSITPVLLLPIALFYHKEKLHYKEVLGAFVAVAGVGLMFL